MASTCGTIGAYIKGCRCEDCKRAQYEKNRRQRLAREPRRPMHAWEWSERKACVGVPVKVFFPGRGNENYTEARAYCKACPVRVECLEDAIRTEGASMRERFGMRGGMTPEERHRFAGLFQWKTLRPRSDVLAGLAAV